MASHGSNIARINRSLSLLLCNYQTLNHINHNALWIDLNAEDIDHNAVLVRIHTASSI